MSQAGNTSTNPEENQHGMINDHATKAKIRKHLSDINDVITEQDIRNVKTDITLTLSAAEQDELAAHEADKLVEEKKKNKQDGNNDPSVDTSWNILGA